MTSLEDADRGLGDANRGSRDAESSRARISRISKACENCRTRRIKCEPPYPCKACRAAQLTDCNVRTKARPGRHAKAQDAAKMIRNTSHRERITGLRRLDGHLETAYAEATGHSIDLELVEEYTHPDLDLSGPMPDPPQLDPSASLAIRAFTIYGLPYCSFLTSQRIVHLFDRYAASPTSLTVDQAALVSSCLACGYLRLQYFSGPSRAANYVKDEERLDVAWYRKAVSTLDEMGSATFTSLHALSVVWFYTTLACTSDATRYVTAWMISQARELGLHREQTAMAIPYSPTDRADLMFFQILYAHYYSAGRNDHPPMFKPGEFDTIILPPSRPVMSDPPAALVPRQRYLELTLLNTQLLLNLHDETVPSLSVDWLLRIEDRWAVWLRAWVREGRTTGVRFADPFVGVLWDWGRLLVRAATIDDNRFAVSSLAVLARSASQILFRYHDFYLAQHYNLVWQHLRHVVTSAHLVLLCFWRFEITKREAESSLSTAVWILVLSEPRWTGQARRAREKIEAIAMSFGLELFPIEPITDREPPDPQTSWISSLYDDAQTGLLFTDTPIVDTFSTFDYLFGQNSTT